ncbi:hypothetical protein [Alishewanella longhuensis]
MTVNCAIFGAVAFMVERDYNFGADRASCLVWVVV